MHSTPDVLIDEWLADTARLAGIRDPLAPVVYPCCFHGFRKDQKTAISCRAEADSLRALQKALT